MKGQIRDVHPSSWNFQSLPVTFKLEVYCPYQVLPQVLRDRVSLFSCHSPCPLPYASLLFSGSVVSYSLRPHGLQHTRLSCPSPSPRVRSSLCPLSQWCHPTILSSVTPSPPTFNLSQHQGLFNKSVLRITWPKNWSFSFSISPSNEYSGLISFRID